jgi:hypothetical protein
LAYGEREESLYVSIEKNIQGDRKREDAECYDGIVWAKSGYTGSIKIIIQCELIGWIEEIVWIRS